MSDRRVILIVVLLCLVSLGIAVPWIIISRANDSQNSGIRAPVVKSSASSTAPAAPSATQPRAPVAPTTQYSRALIALMPSLEHELALASRYYLPAYEPVWTTLKIDEGTVVDDISVVSATADWVAKHPDEPGAFHCNEYERQIRLATGYLGPLLVPSKDNLRRVSFREHSGKLVIVLPTILGDEVYNTLKLQAKQRAARVVTRSVLRRVGVLGRAFNSSDVRYVMFVVVYSNRDFSKEDSVRNREGEAIAVVIPIDVAEKYDRLSISDQQLLDASEIFLYDSESHSARRTQLTLE